MAAKVRQNVASSCQFGQYIYGIETKYLKRIFRFFFRFHRGHKLVGHTSSLVSNDMKAGGGRSLRRIFPSKKYKITRSQSMGGGGVIIDRASKGSVSSKGGSFQPTLHTGNEVIYESNLLLLNVGHKESGVYSCVPSSGLPNATVKLHVLKGR